MAFSCSRTSSVPEVRIGHAPHDHHAPLYVAAVKQEYFKNNGGVYLKELVYKEKYQLYKNDKVIAVLDISSGTGGIQLIKQLDERIVDITFGGVPAMIDMIDKGSRIKIVAPVMSEGAALVVDKDFPAENWKEFIDYIKTSGRQVKIGYKTAVSVQNLIFESALKTEGINFSSENFSKNAQVLLLNMHGAKNLIPTMESHIINGFVVMQPFPALSQYSETGKVIAYLRDLPPAGVWEDHPCCALAAGPEFIKKEGDIIEALIELFSHAVDFMSENPQESASIVAKWLGTPVQVESMSLPSIKFMNTYNEHWDNGVNTWISSLIASGEISSRVKEAFEKGEADQLIYDKRFYKNINRKLGRNVDK